MPVRPVWRLRTILGRLAMVATLGLMCLQVGCADSSQATASPRPGQVLSSMSMSPELEDRILALNPDHISDNDVQTLLARGPAPRIINFNGSVPIVTMDSFSRFLIGMGYPAAKIQDPRSGSYTYGSYVNSEKMAGMVAWYYEHDGLAPILIGHSQGGMAVIKVLHELAGDWHEQIPVWNPRADRSEQRTTIVDPLTGQQRPVPGVRVGYACAIATGKRMRVLLGQWNMIGRLRQVPDTTETFTGFFLAGDPIGGDWSDDDLYAPLGSASVRNVRLPLGYEHLSVVLTEHLAKNRAAREWINNYVPGDREPQAPSLGGDTRNILLAAEVWYDVKRQWCLEVQRLIRAARK